MVLGTFVGWGQQFILSFSYIAILVMSAVSSSTIFLPIPFLIFIPFAVSLGLNPLLTGVSAGIGSAIGELTSYFIGAGSRSIIEEKRKKTPKIIARFSKHFKKYGTVIIILIAFQFIIPFDFVGILSGVSKYDIKKFFLAVAIGKTLKYLLFAYLGIIIAHYPLPLFE